MALFSNEDTNNGEKFGEEGKERREEIRKETGILCEPLDKVKYFGSLDSIFVVSTRMTGFLFLFNFFLFFFS